MPTIPHPRVNRNNKKDLIIDSNFSVLYKPEVTWGLNGGGGGGGGQLPHF